MTSSFSAVYIALWALVVFQGFVLLVVLQQLDRLRRIASRGHAIEDQLPEGTQAPEFANMSRRFERHFGIGSIGERGGVILFLSSQCSDCSWLADRLGRFGADDIPSMIAFCQGREQGCARLAKRLGSRIPLVVDGANETAARYHVSGFPTAIAIDSKLKIRGYGHPKDIDDIKELWSRCEKTVPRGTLNKHGGVLATLNTQ